MDKSVDEISPSSTEEVSFSEQGRHKNSSSVTSSTTLPTTSKAESMGTTMVPTRPAIHQSWPDGTKFVPVESMLAGHPSSGLAPRLFYNSIDSSSSGASGYFGSMDSSSSGHVLYFGSMDSNASGHEGLFNPYGMVHGSLMSASTAEFAAAVAAGMNPMGSYVNFGSSSMDALTNPGVSGSTDSSGSSASSSLGFLNMLTLMSSQSMDSLDGTGIDPFASLNISLSSASSDIIHNIAVSGSGGSDSVCIANNTVEVSEDTNSNSNNNSSNNNSDNMKSRKRKSTSPSHAEENEEVDKTEDASPSSTTSQNDDATAATTATTTTTTRIKTSSSSSSSRQQRGKQQKDPSSSSSSTSDNVSGGIEGKKSRRSIAQLTEQVDQQKQTQPRKKK